MEKAKVNMIQKQLALAYGFLLMLTFVFSFLAVALHSFTAALIAMSLAVASAHTVKAYRQNIQTKQLQQ